jgi:chromosome segregation protein
VQKADIGAAAIARAEAEARAARTAAERVQATARAEIARAGAEIDRQAARAEAMEAALTRLAAEADGHAAEAQAARDAAAEVTGLPALASAVASLRGETEAARARLAKSRAAHDNQARALQAATARSTDLAGETARWSERLAASAAQSRDLAARAALIAAEAEQLAARPAQIAADAAVLATDIAAAEASRRAAADALVEREAALRAIDTAARSATAALADAREARARAVANAEHHDARRAEFAILCGERFQTAPVRLPELLGFEPGGDIAALATQFDALTAERDRLGPVNLRAATELAEIDATMAQSAADRAELETAIARLRGSIGALNREGRVRLLAAFEIVDGHFRELFATLFASDSGPGQAHLALTNSDDPLAAGLEIMAQPPGKKLQSLTLLSGGEQALTAIALIFALFLTTPAPLCVLDEVDAPLDDANVERFCDLLDRMAATTATRFLIVTHNAVTMSRMHRLYGVTMGEPGVSQLVSVDLARAEALLAVA